MQVAAIGRSLASKAWQSVCKGSLKQESLEHALTWGKERPQPGKRYLTKENWIKADKKKPTPVSRQHGLPGQPLLSHTRSRQPPQGAGRQGELPAS